MSVFVERRVTTRERGPCTTCGGSIHTSDPCISERISPWAYGDSTGEWQIYEFCHPCGAHRYPSHA